MNKPRKVALTQLEQPAPTDEEILTANGFSAEETTSILWLRQWYQSGGSDRASIVRHWEYLKLMVASGRIEV
jgi:hypothetical protein